MLFDDRCVARAQDVFSQLSVSIALYDAFGQCVVPEDGMPIAYPLPPLKCGLNHRHGDLLMRLMDVQPAYVLACDAAAPGAEDVLTVADALLMAILKSGLSISGHSDVFRRALKEELSGADLDALAGEHLIDPNLQRAVMLFTVRKTERSSAYALMGDVIPHADTDALIEMDRHTVALVKDMTGVDGVDELTQLARAVQETLLQETATAVVVGVGEAHHTLSALGASYREAKRAMEVGRTFLPEDTIYVFRRLMLERFLMDLPRDMALYYHGLLFNRRTARLFNDEMLATIGMFFRKDLNLSDTARQLYIHRNTLVYRLDKVQRQTGLDLRRFEDAVTFKILVELKKCGAEKPETIR